MLTQILTTPDAHGEIEIVSYGSLHGEPPTGHGYLVDASTNLRNPHHDPRMREMTALDHEVYAHVMETPGAVELAEVTAARLLALLRLDDGQPVRALIYCRGGRHRSASIAYYTAVRLWRAGVTVRLVHRDLDKPVVQPVEQG